MNGLNGQQSSQNMNELVSKLIQILGLPNEVEQRALDILKQADQQGVLRGHNLHSQAGAAIYIASILTNNRVTQSVIAKQIGVSEATVRKRYIEIVKGLNIG